MKGNQNVESQNQHVETMHHYTAGKIRCVVILYKTFLMNVTIVFSTLSCSFGSNNVMNADPGPAHVTKPRLKVLKLTRRSREGQEASLCKCLCDPNITEDKLMEVLESYKTGKIKF